MGHPAAVHLQDRQGVADGIAVGEVSGDAHGAHSAAHGGDPTCRRIPRWVLEHPPDTGQAEIFRAEALVDHRDADVLEAHCTRVDRALEAAVGAVGGVATGKVGPRNVRQEVHRGSGGLHPHLGGRTQVGVNGPAADRGCATVYTQALEPSERDTHRDEEVCDHLGATPDRSQVFGDPARTRGGAHMGVAHHTGQGDLLAGRDRR